MHHAAEAAAARDTLAAMGIQPKGIAVLGSTGSIGRQTLDVIRGLPGRFRVVALAGGSNHTLLEDQAREFAPDLVWCQDGARHMELKAASGRSARWAAMEEMASHPEAEIVVVATSGIAGLMPTLTALRAGKAVALANKEVLVMAGHIVTRAAEQGRGELRPIDSEHSAIWQCLWGEDLACVERLILTASGGAFRDVPARDLERVTPQQALRHPTWEMGRKITIDSATLMNKGFEAIEARWLFNVPMDRIEIVMHRESIVHSLVEFADGSVKAQLGEPDMRLPIQCAIAYPERVPGAAPPRLSLARTKALNFSEPDLQRYPCLRLALEAGARSGTWPAVLAAADEVAVDTFLAGRIAFTDIAKVVDATLSAHAGVADPVLETVLEADRWAREYAGIRAGQMSPLAKAR
jgi:1-deoxy-D-xylulose-5-phosphate reductoisomerase